MKKFILVLFLFFSIGGMAIHVHHFHHHTYHHSSPHRNSHVTTQTRNVRPHKVRSIQHRNTKEINTVWRNGILYYVILNPRKGHVYGNKWVLCEGCKKVLVKKGVKYCSKCRKIKRIGL
jgi:hypothetical protein